MSLKLFVNNPELWDSFNKEVDEYLKLVHKNMEQMDRSEDLYRLQGEARAYHKLKMLRDKVNG
jgi:hypothetical protein